MKSAMAKALVLALGLVFFNPVASAAKAYPKLEETNLFRETATGCETVDLQAWKHPAREVLKKYGVSLYKLLSCNQKKYPVFFVRFAYDLSSKNNAYFESFFKEILTANGRHPLAFVSARDEMVFTIKPGKQNALDMGYEPYIPLPADIPRDGEAPPLIEGTSLLPGSQKPSLSRNGELSCYDYPKYFVVTSPTEGAGYDILVKPKKTSTRNTCTFLQTEGDILFKNTDAEIFVGITSRAVDDILFTDNGTGPDSRDLFLYSLKSKAIILNLWGVASAALVGPGTLSFWTQIGNATYGEEAIGEATPQNCGRFHEWRKDQFGVALETRMLLNLENLKTTPTLEFRCGVRQ